MNIQKIIFRSLLIILCICLGIGIFVLIRGQMLVTRFYKVNEQSANQIRIVALADLHGNAKGHKQKQLVSCIKKENPGLIMFLGDMVDRNEVEESMAVLLSLTESLAEIAPIYYVDGNHEQDVKDSAPEKYAQMIEGMTEIGAVQLENETVSLKVEKNKADSEECVKVNICGIGTHYYWGDEEYALTEKLRAMEGINVLICHYPESVMWYDAFDGGGLDVALCGHAHGGLIRVPFKGGVYAPEQGRWPLYDLGEYKVFTDTTWNDYGGKEDSEYLGTMIISGGLAGEHGIPRINNPREVSVVDIG